MVAAHDVALYGTICAVAKLSRNEIKPHVLHNAAFQPYLDLAPVRPCLRTVSTS